MSYEWGDALKTKMASLFASDADRDAACALLAPVIDGTEGERVAVACLKLAGGDVAQLEKYANTALIDYRDILAWAESPRQMRLGPSAPAAEQLGARRADADEYARWLRDS